MRRRWITWRRSVGSGVVLVLLSFLLWLNFPFFPDPVILILNRPTSDLTSQSSLNHWTMNGRDMAQTRYVKSGQTPLPAEKCWSKYLGEPTRSGPIVKEGVVYVGGHFEVMALDASTGEVLWSTPTSGPINSDLAIAGNHLYAGLLDHRLLSMNATNGELNWNFKTGDIITASPVVSDGMVYIGSWDNSIYSLDAETGEVIWRFLAKDTIPFHPAVHKEKLYVTDSSGHLYILDARTGQEFLMFRTPGSTSRTPVLDQGLAYFPSGGRIFAVEADAKEVPGEFIFKRIWAQFWIWQVPGVPKPPKQAGGVWAFSPKGFTEGGILASPAISGQAFFAGDIQGHVFARSKINGSAIWEQTVEGGILAPPLVVHDQILVGTDTGYIYSFDKHSGEETGQIQIGAPIEIPLIMANNLLLIRTTDGWLHCLK